jgi:hypothetical protein
MGRTLPQGLDGRTGVGVDECAAAARSRGFPLFALQGKGQCFFGSMADVARVQASQSKSDETCNDLPCPTSATTCRTFINKVYMLTGAHISHWGSVHCPRGKYDISKGAASQADLLASCPKIAIQASAVKVQTYAIDCGRLLPILPANQMFTLGMPHLPGLQVV